MFLWTPTSKVCLPLLQATPTPTIGLLSPTECSAIFLFFCSQNLLSKKVQKLKLICITIEIASDCLKWGRGAVKLERVVCVCTHIHIFIRTFIIEFQTHKSRKKAVKNPHKSISFHIYRQSAIFASIYYYLSPQHNFFSRLL